MATKGVCESPAAIEALTTVGMTWLLKTAGAPKNKAPQTGLPTLHRAGCAGYGRHGGGAPAMCGRPLMSALNFWSFSFKRKGQKNSPYLHQIIILSKHPPKSMDKHRGNDRIPFAPLNNRFRQIHPCLITNWETTAKTGIRLMG